MYRRLLSLWAAIVLLLVGILPANASAYGRVQITDNTEVAFVDSIADVAPAASTTDLFVKGGSASKTVFIQRIEILYSFDDSTTTGHAEFHLLKRSTAGSGGTSSSATQVQLDSSSASPTSTALLGYTANPTVGTLVGRLNHAIVRGQPRSGQTMAYGSGQSGFTVLWDSRTDGPLVLRGTAETAAVSCNGTKPYGTTPKVSCRVIYREK